MKVKTKNLKEYRKKWQEDNRDKCNAAQKRYRKANKDNMEFKKIKAQQAATWEQANRMAWIAFLKELNYTKCSICGYDECFAAIEFHHVNPKEKLKSMGTVMAYKISDDGIKELKKTIPLCANCHRKLHDDKKKMDKFKI